MGLRLRSRSGRAASGEPDSVVVSTPRVARFAVLDGLRFLAAFAVLAFHFTAREHDSWGVLPEKAFPTLHQYTALGAFGVDLFFVISGFVILMTAWGRTLPDFIGSRAGRLLPAYWTGVLLTGLLLLVIWPDRKPVTIPQIGINLTMLQTGFGVTHVDGVYWTLWAELRFYILIGIFMIVGITASRVLVVAAVWPVAAAIAESTGFTFVANVLIWDYAPLFAGGMALFCVLQDRRSLIAWCVLAQNVLIAGVHTAQRTGAIVTSTTPMDPGPTVFAALTTLCFVFVAVAVLTPVNRISWRWLTTIGALTFPLYIIHEYWGWWFIDRLEGHLPKLVVLAITTAACLLMAWGINRFIERPLGPRLRTSVSRSVGGLATAGRLDVEARTSGERRSPTYEADQSK